MNEPVSFKGNKDGIVLLLDSTIDFELLCQMIVQKLWQSRSFLGEHTTLIVNSGDVSLNDGQRLALKVLLQSLGHEVKYFLPEQSVSEQETAVAEPEMEETVTHEPEEKPIHDGLLESLAGIEHYLANGALAVRKNIRSGQKVAYDGTLIVFGDVNAGAELVATGHILVLGTLRGVAHAGCQGDKNAVVYATQLCSLQLRIADMIARAPDGESTERRVPEIARIIDNYLVIEEM
ncbi:MAG: septum site-determining protein MinC [Peptococcaceae bacterium]